MPAARSSIRNHRRRSAAELAAFAEAWLALAAAALRLKALPFEKVMRGRAPPFAAALHGADTARLVWAVNAARRRSWLRAMCIESALALRTLLGRRGVAATLHYGIRKGAAGELEGHVWLSVGGEILIGGETAEQFTQVATFEAPPA